jgi:hypothetical protein
MQSLLGLMAGLSAADGCTSVQFDSVAPARSSATPTVLSAHSSGSIDFSANDAAQFNLVSSPEKWTALTSVSIPYNNTLMPSLLYDTSFTIQVMLRHTLYNLANRFCPLLSLGHGETQGRGASKKPTARGGWGLVVGTWRQVMACSLLLDTKG